MSESADVTSGSSPSKSTKSSAQSKQSSSFIDLIESSSSSSSSSDSSSSDSSGKPASSASSNKKSKSAASAEEEAAVGTVVGTYASYTIPYWIISSTLFLVCLFPGVFVILPYTSYLLKQEDTTVNYFNTTEYQEFQKRECSLEPFDSLEYSVPTDDYFRDVNISTKQYHLQRFNAFCILDPRRYRVDALPFVTQVPTKLLDTFCTNGVIILGYVYDFSTETLHNPYYPAELLDSKRVIATMGGDQHYSLFWKRLLHEYPTEQQTMMMREAFISTSEAVHIQYDHPSSICDPSTNNYILFLKFLSNFRYFAGDASIILTVEPWKNVLDHHNYEFIQTFQKMTQFATFVIYATHRPVAGTLFGKEECSADADYVMRVAESVTKYQLDGTPCYSVSLAPTLYSYESTIYSVSELYKPLKYSNTTGKTSQQELCHDKELWKPLHSDDKSCCKLISKLAPDLKTLVATYRSKQNMIVRRKELNVHGLGSSCTVYTDLEFIQLNDSCTDKHANALGLFDAEFNDDYHNPQQLFQ